MRLTCLFLVLSDVPVSQLYVGLTQPLHVLYDRRTAGPPQTIYHVHRRLHATLQRGVSTL